jgi:hypothetical protein
VENNLIPDLIFDYVNEGADSWVHSLCEIENNIILVGGYMILHLFDLSNNQVKHLHKVNLEFQNFIDKILMLSNGLIAIYNHSLNIFFYKYNKENKIIEKVDTLRLNEPADDIWEGENGNIILLRRLKKGASVSMYGQNKQFIIKISFDKEMAHYFYLENYIFIFYNNTDDAGIYKESFVDIYSLKGFKALQTLEVIILWLNF